MDLYFGHFRQITARDRLELSGDTPQECQFTPGAALGRVKFVREDFH
jgi:hypothetical protein